MAARQNVTAARVTNVTITGTKGSADITPNTRTIIIRESICSPYITAELQVLDNNNTIVNLGLIGGSLCHVEFDAVTGTPYVIDLMLLEAKGESSPENMDLKVYTLSFVTSEYFTDQGTRTPETSEIQMTGCQLVKKIWGDAGFQTPLRQMPPDAPIQDGNQSLTIGLMKPFTAIGQVRDIQVYPSHPTGNVLLYRDAKSVVHTPLQYIYQSALGGATLVQSQTWGIDYHNFFIGGPTDNAIISIIETTRATMLDPESFKPGERGADDIATGKMSLGELVGGGLKAAAHALTNSDKTSAAIDHTSIMTAARAYAHCVKSQVQYMVRIPIQSGINITVGTSVTLQLTPTTSDGHTAILNPNDGDYLVTDLIHEVHNDLREVLGTTNLQCLKQGDCAV